MLYTRTDRCFGYVIVDVSVEGRREERRGRRGHLRVNFYAGSIRVRFWLRPVTTPGIVAPPTWREHVSKLHTSCWYSCMKLSSQSLGKSPSSGYSDTPNLQNTVHVRMYPREHNRREGSILLHYGLQPILLTESSQAKLFNVAHRKGRGLLSEVACRMSWWHEGT